MGVIYKLKPEVAAFILESKKADPKLSCRSMVALVESKFQTKVSKSSINDLFKENSLSMPVGRRRTKRKYTLKLEGMITAQTKELVVKEKAVTEQGLSPENTEAPKPIGGFGAPPSAGTVPVVQEVSKPIEMPAPPAEARAEAEAKARQEADQRARAEAAAREKRLAEETARRQAEEKVKLEATFKAQVEAERKAAHIVQTEGTFAGLGAIFLKSADYLLGGSQFISEIIKSRLKAEEKELLAKSEFFIYNSLFGVSPATPVNPDCGLWPLLNSKFSPEELSTYLNRLQETSALPLDMLRAIAGALQEVRGIKLNLSDGTAVYLDGQLHTIWSTVHIPYNFSTTIYNVKTYIKRYFQEDSPFVLFMAPGYDLPTKEFFDFILGLEGDEKRIISLGLYNNRFEEIEIMRVNPMQKRRFIFGLWPWQFAEYRQVKTLGEFKPFHFAPLKKDFYLANLELELIQPDANKKVTLRGCALKAGPAEKARLLILSNSPAEKLSPEELASAYLNRWPNLEEAFQDYSRKVELFTYTATSQRFFSTENLELPRGADLDINTIFSYYLKALDLYARWHLFPIGYEDKDFPTAGEQFYSLAGRIEAQKDNILLTFQPPAGYPYLKALEYACRRVNELEVFLGGRRLWLLL